jgi:Trypsin-like peptidase domain
MSWVGSVQPVIPNFIGRVLDASGRPVGTCFQITPGVLVTAGHVLQSVDAAHCGARLHVGLLAGEGSVFDVAVAAVDLLHDLAVLDSAHELPACVPGLAATLTVPLQTGVIVDGVADVPDPVHEYQFIQATGIWQGSTVRGDGVVLGRFTSAGILPGMSGAPVRRSSDGTVVGLVSARYNSGDGWLAHTAWAAITEDLAALLLHITPTVLLDVSEETTDWRTRRSTYLRAVEHLARHAPDPLLVGSSGPPFQSVQLRRHTHHRREAGDNPAQPDQAGSGPQLVTDAELATADDDCWIVGSAGTGKSRLLREWALRGSTTEDSAAEDRRIPLPVRAADVAAAIGSPAGPVPAIHSVAAAINAGLQSAGAAGLPWLPGWLASPGPGSGSSGWLLLADGFDEVPEPRSRRQVLNTLRQATRELPLPCRVVVSSRPLDVSTGQVPVVPQEDWPGEWYEPLGFAESQRDELALAWFSELGVEDPERDARSFAAQLEQQGVREVAKIPLMLVILAQLFAYTPHAALPGSRVGAYERIIEEIYRRRPEQVPTMGVPGGLDDPGLAEAARSLDERLGGLEGLIGQLALARLRGEARNATDWIAEQSDDLRLSGRSSCERWKAIIDVLLRRCPLLVARGNDFEFTHFTVQEFFAARHLAADPVARRVFLWLLTRGSSFDDHIRSMNYDLMHRMEGFPARLEDVDVHLVDWIYGFWSEWQPFTKVMEHVITSELFDGAAFVASLIWRGIRVHPELVASARRHLAASFNPDFRLDDDSPGGTSLLRDLAARSPEAYDSVLRRLHTAAHLAILGEAAGSGALADAAHSSDVHREFRIRAAKILIEVGDPRGTDVYADAVESIVSSAIPFTASEPRYGYEMYFRRNLAHKLAESGNPRAAQILKIFLTDERFDAKTRSATYRMLAMKPDDPHSARAFAILASEVPCGPARDDSYGRSWGINMLTNARGTEHRDALAILAGAAATVSPQDRLEAAGRLAEMGDSRAADLLAGLLRNVNDAKDFTEWNACMKAAQAWAGLGDPRSAEPLVALLAIGAREHWGGSWEPPRPADTQRAPQVTDVLVRIVDSPDLPVYARDDVIQALARARHPHGLHLAVTSAVDPATPAPALLDLADTLARVGDPRFTDLLTAWIARIREENDQAANKQYKAWDYRDIEWAENLLACPESFLGDEKGIWLARLTPEDFPRSAERIMMKLLETSHPEAACHLASLFAALPAPSGAASDRVNLAIVFSLARFGVVGRLPDAMRSIAAYLQRVVRAPGTSDKEATKVLDALLEMDAKVIADTLIDLAPDFLRHGRRFDLAWKLSACGDIRIGDIIVAWLRELDEERDYRPLDMLVKIKDPRAADFIDRWTTRSPSEPRQAPQELQELAALDGEPVRDILVRWSRDPGFDRITQSDAIRVLAAVGDVRAAGLADQALGELPDADALSKRRIQADFAAAFQSLSPLAIHIVNLYSSSRLGGRLGTRRAPFRRKPIVSRLDERYERYLWRRMWQDLRDTKAVRGSQPERLW